MGEFEHDAEALLAEVALLRNRLRTAEATAATFRALVENRRDLILYIDPSGRIIYVSPSYCALYGKCEAELQGSHFEPPIHPDDQEMVRASLRRLRQPPYETTHVERAMAPQGQRWLSWAGRALLDDDGCVRGFVGIGRDITEEQRAYQALAASEQRLRQIIDLVPMHIFAKDAQGRFFLANSAMAVESGMLPQDVLGQTDAVFGEGEAAVRRYLETDRIVLTTGQPWESSEEKVTRANGEAQYLFKRKIPFTTASGEPAILGVSMDITDRVRAEQALRESQQRFTAFFDASPLGLAVLDRDLRYVLVNRALAAMNRQPVEEHLGRRIDDVLTHGHRLRPLLEQMLAGEQPLIDMDYALDLGDGAGTRYFRFACFPLGEGERRLVGLVVANITESERARRALEATEARLRGIYESVQAGVVVHAPDGRLIHANPAAARILGLPQQGILGLTAAAPVWRMVDETGAHVPPEEHPSMITLRTGQPVRGAVRGLYTGQPQRLVWLLINTEPVTDPASGALLEVVVTFADITAPMAAEQALRESEARYRTLFEQTANPILVIDTEGHYLEANQAALSFLETDRDTMLKRTVRDLAPLGEETDAILAQHTELWRTGGRADAEYVVHGRLKVLDLTITPAQWRGRDVVFGVGRDVTEQRRMEERLREMNKLEAIGQLAGGVAHEFNNLLTVINGNAEMLADTLGNSHPGTHDVADILRAGHRAAGLVQQLLAFGRRQMVSVQVLDLRAVLERSCAMLRRLLPDRVLLDVALASDTGAVRGDPTQFDQIILALGYNARDAMPAGGTLTVRTSNVAFGERYINGPVALEPGSYVLLEIIDTGTGMTPEVIAHLFEPFFTTKEVGQGSGLGLAVVYGIVKQLGGEIEVESRLGHGTRFRIYLPRVDAPPPQTLPLDQAATAPLTVLVVEDEPAVRRLAVRMLTDLGYRALEAVTAQQALEMCHRDKGRIALLLADVGMPGMSGPELARAMGPDCPQVPILYMTGYGAQAVEEEQPPTVRGVITKPFARAQLAEWVERIIGPGQPAPRRARS